MELKSMKSKPSEVKEEIAESRMEEEKYPYGLRIHLDSNSIENLAMKELPKVGDSIMVFGKATISGVHESESMGGKKNRSVDIQITDLALESEKSKKSPEEVIYGDD